MGEVKLKSLYELDNIGQHSYPSYNLTLNIFETFFENTKFHLTHKAKDDWCEYLSNCKTIGLRFDSIGFLRKVYNPETDEEINAFRYWPLLNEQGKNFWLDKYFGQIDFLINYHQKIAENYMKKYGEHIFTAKYLFEEYSKFLKK